MSDEPKLTPVYKKMRKRAVTVGKQITIEGDAAITPKKDRCMRGKDCAHNSRGTCTHRHWNTNKTWGGSCPYFARRVPSSLEIDSIIKTEVIP